MESIKNIVCENLFEIMLLVMPEYWDMLDEAQVIEELPENIIFDREEYATSKAHDLGYSDFFWTSSEKTENTYTHYGIGYISYDHKLFQLKYSYRSDC